jgi:hypothetical protein
VKIWEGADLVHQVRGSYSNALVSVQSHIPIVVVLRSRLGVVAKKVQWRRQSGGGFAWHQTREKRPRTKGDDEDERLGGMILEGWGSFRLQPEPTCKCNPIAVILETDDKTFGNA